MVQAMTRFFLNLADRWFVYRFCLTEHETIRHSPDQFHSNPLT